jgi:hypothetical protein
MSLMLRKQVYCNRDKWLLGRVQSNISNSMYRVFQSIHCSLARKIGEEAQQILQILQSHQKCYFQAVSDFVVKSTGGSKGWKHPPTPFY